MGLNLISFQFKTKRDMKWVLAIEPWHFNKHVLVLKPFRGDIQPSTIKFDSTPFWIKVYDLPMVGREEKVLRQIGSRFGDVLEIEHKVLEGISRSVRMKVLVQLDKPLKEGQKFRLGSLNHVGSRLHMKDYRPFVIIAQNWVTLIKTVAIPLNRKMRRGP